jgi:hypothetical protein
MAWFRKHTTITRVQFEDCLQTCFDVAGPGTFAKVKAAVGGAWTVVIDDMYRENAERINPKNVMEVITECANTILGTLKKLKERSAPPT